MNEPLRKTLMLSWLVFGIAAFGSTFLFFFSGDWQIVYDWSLPFFTLNIIIGGALAFDWFREDQKEGSDEIS